MIEHNGLELTVCPHNLIPKGTEYRSDGRNILIPAAPGNIGVMLVEAGRKIDLAGLIKNQKSWNGMVRSSEKKTL